MKEIRLTFSADDFGAVSQALIGMGIGFRVEPVEDRAGSAAPTRPPPPPPSAPRRKAAGSAGKSASKRPRKRNDRSLTGADRLRNAIARRQESAGPASSGATRPATPEAADIARAVPLEEPDA